MNAQAERTWWQRNWKWVLVAALLASLLLLAGLVFAILTFASGMLRSSEPYRLALDRARAHPAVAAALGTPIEPGWLPQGSIKIENRSGEADLGIAIRGPRGEGIIDVVASRRAGEWRYELMRVKAGAESIDLRTPQERATKAD